MSVCSRAQKIIESGEPRLAVTAEYIYKDTLKSLARRWDPKRKAWILPYTPEAWQSVYLSIPGIAYDDAIENELSGKEMDIDKPIPDAPPMPIKAHIKPFRHQQGAYANAINRFYSGGQGYAYWMEMGTGKSLTAVGTVGRLYLDGRAKRVLVIAPLAVVPVWPREFADYADFEHTVAPLEGDRNKKLKALATLGRFGKGLQVAVINYESAWRIAEELIEWDADVVICDESQRIKDPQSKQSKAIHRLGREARYKLILSGTPISNSPLDVFSQYKFLDSNIFGENWFPFRAEYAITGQEVNHQTGKSYTRVIGDRDLPELVEKAHSIAYRVTKAAALDLPEQVEQTLYCELEPRARKAYNDLRKHSIAELDGLPAVTAQHVIVRLLRLSQICGGFLRTDIDGFEDDPNAGQLLPISDAKQRLFEETLDDILGAGKKVVVFARFTAEVRRICKYVGKKYGEGAYRLIDGSVKGEDRGEAVRAFQEDPGVRVFVAQIATAGLGITLTAADTAIYYSYDYSYANYEQSRARIHRIGQKNTCTYLHLAVRDSIDEEVMEVLRHKGNIATMCVDKWKELLK